MRKDGLPYDEVVTRLLMIGISLCVVVLLAKNIPWRMLWNFLTCF